MHVQDISKKTLHIGLYSIGILVLVVGVYAIVRAAMGSGVPSDFSVAQREAGRVGDEIVALTGQTREKIRSANLIELRGNPDAAVALINDARTTNAQAYDKAIELTGQLQKIAESLSSMGSARNRGLAYDAVGEELSLVTEFIVYTQQLNSFLEDLGKVIVTGSDQDRALAEAALKGVNEKADRINTINTEFAAKMKTFNESL